MRVEKRTQFYVTQSDLNKAVLCFLKKHEILKNDDSDPYKPIKASYSCEEEENWAISSTKLHEFNVHPECLIDDCFPFDNVNGKYIVANMLHLILNWMCIENEIEMGKYYVVPDDYFYCCEEKCDNEGVGAI